MRRHRAEQQNYLKERGHKLLAAVYIEGCDPVNKGDVMMGHSQSAGDKHISTDHRVIPSALQHQDLCLVLRFVVNEISTFSPV